MQTETYPRVLGDVGGTNARFAWQQEPGAAPSAVTTRACAEYDSLLAAIRHYLQAHGKAVPAACALGIANPVVGDLVQMTNHHWSFSISQLQQQLGVRHLAVVNDFTALALALPSLDAGALHRIGGGEAQPGAPLAVLGAGTGLGVSGLIPRGDGRYAPITGEGGHATLSADNPEEAAVLEQLRIRFGHASAERVLSGPGLVNLYAALCSLSGRSAMPLQPADVLRLAQDSSDAQCTQAVQMFLAFLGGMAGNLALTLGATGGVYIGGGIAPRLVEQLKRSSFRERFERKGRFRAYLSAIPTFVIDSAISPALIGASRALDLQT